ncbi:MAG: LysR family transcriptional regulator [Pseudomonadota bacterium]
MDQIKAMHIFRCVAECNSFTRAALRLALPKPTVTNAVQSLEQQLGVRLLQRTTRKVSLTVEGTTYLERCTALLSDLDAMNALFRADGHVPSGVVRVDLPERMAHVTVIPALPDFFRRYPDIEVKLGANDRFADLVGEGIDCAVRVGTLRDSSLVARGIGEMSQLNCASKSYVARYGRPRSLDDLSQHYAVAFFSGQSGREMDWEYQAAGRVHTLPMRSMVSVSSTEAFLAACVAGLGLIQAPRMGLADLLASGVLEQVLPDWPPPPLPISIIYSHTKQLTPRVRVFVDWLAALLQAANK